MAIQSVFAASAPQPHSAAGKVVTARGGESGIVHRSTDAHVQYWTGGDIQVEIHAERLLRAYAIWSAAHKQNLPFLRDVIGTADSQIDGDILLYLRVGDDYLVVDQGADHVRHVGKDLRGMKISQFNAAVSPVLKELYDEALRTHQAIYCRFVSDLAPNSYFWEGLFLPVCSDDIGGAHFVLNYNRPIDSKADILQMILDRSPVGMIAAVPIGGRDGELPDGRIISMNARAKSILKLDTNRSRVNYIREIAPWLRDVAKMSRIDMAKDAQHSDILYRGEAGQTYRFTVEALKRFILFSIVEQGGPAGAHSSGASSIGS